MRIDIRKIVAHTFIIALVCLYPVCKASDMVITSYIRDDMSLYIPLRTAAEGLGFTVNWDDETNIVYVDDGNRTILYAAEDEDSAIFILYDRAYISATAFSMFHSVCVHEDVNQVLLTHFRAADPKDMETNLDIIANAPRPFGGENIMSIRTFLVKFMKDMGYDVNIYEFEHRMSRTWNEIAILEGIDTLIDIDLAIASNDVAFHGGNVVAIKPAINEDKPPAILIISAHYDSFAWDKGVFDNGSGVVIVMEIARLIRDLTSNIEVRIVYFDATIPGRYGSYYYANALTLEERDRIIGVINYDTLILSDSAITLYANTTDGISNQLSNLFTMYEIGSMSRSDHVSFFPYAIPSVSISSYKDNLFKNKHGHSVDVVDAEKMAETATYGYKVIHSIMKKLNEAYFYDQEDLLSEKSYPRIDLSERNALTMLQDDRTRFTNKNDLVLTQHPTSPMFPEDNVSSWLATIEWWGRPMETIFTYRDTMRPIARITCDDIEWLITTLDKYYTRISINEGYRFQNINYAFGSPASDEVSKFVVWRGESGHCYILNPSKDSMNVLITTYSKQTNTTVVDGWYEELSAIEKKAWNKVEKYLKYVELENTVNQVTFIDDGYGGNDLDIVYASYIDAQGKMVTINTVLLDVADILDVNGSLYEENALARLVLRHWARGYFEGATQKESNRIEIIEETGEIIVTQGEFYPDSYVAQFVKTFSDNLNKTSVPWDNVQITVHTSMLTPYIIDTLEEQYNNPTMRGLYATVDVYQAFEYFVFGSVSVNSGVVGILKIPVRSFNELYGNDYAEIIDEFFSKFSELAKIKLLFVSE